MKLNNVTLVCIDTKNVLFATGALIRSRAKVEFESTKFFTMTGERHAKKLNESGIEVINIPEIKNKADYSRFCLVELNKYITSDYCLTVQHDGYIIDETAWTDEFLNYDYIGAPWPASWGYKNRVGNGGFCLKSKRFLEACYDTFKDFDFGVNIDRKPEDISVNEDFLICNLYYDHFTNLGIKYADVELASRFSVEHAIPEMKEVTFGFHDKHTLKTRLLRRSN